MVKNMNGCSPSNNLSKYTSSIFLPYTEKFNTNNVPCVNATIDNLNFELPVDTGSTGLFIGAPRLPHVNLTGKPPGHQYLTSSNLLYTGRIVELSITFHGSNGDNATSTVPVLVVERSVKCKWYNPVVDAGKCPPHPKDPSIKPIERDTSRITYMGVGFGRNKKNEDRAIAVPKGNPFLNIESLNGGALFPNAWRKGYTISTEGVHLGLTELNTRGFVFIDLKRGVTHDKDPRDWAMVEMCLRVNDQKDCHGEALIDTGIPQMYLRTDVGIETPNMTIPNPKGEGYVRRVPAGTRIAVGFPSFGGVAGYSFVVGGGEAVEPKHIVPGKQRPPPYVNTGRNLLFRYSVAFDAIGGRFGFRPVSESDSVSHL
ncbi:hypothetical protein GQ43DRAFT_436680 [Delitschia confertaspora ATCC 74209]|uniref:Uncharacterized protein n=1 Tax=Delitschia confertaspora ATCC 74209 TaxID=1513339 RepID=A0A9P4JVE3_9PLEO|nr:hypothetical protein GQ43DRAFT_436680 [Delitschia confertaspora ATCC 74209]